MPKNANIICEGSLVRGRSMTTPTRSGPEMLIFGQFRVNNVPVEVDRWKKGQN